MEIRQGEGASVNKEGSYVRLGAVGIGIADRRFSLLATLGAAVALVALLAAPVHAALSAEDKRTLAGMALQWAIDGGISDFKLVENPNNPIVADFNLPKGTELRVPGRKAILLSLPHIQARADRHGDLLYFRFDRFKGDDQRASVSIALVWAVSARSKQVYLSGGGATLDFQKMDGKWQLLPVTNRWMS
jgi:hypothetical protein